MSNLNVDVCSCCGEVWNRDNQKLVSLGKYTLHLCPDCYNEYITSCNENLNKISTEIKEKYGNYDICKWSEDYDYEENDISEYQSVGEVLDIIAIIDKYRIGSER